MFKSLLTFIIWLSGIYIALFASCLYLHVNESNVIANRANELISKLTREKKLALENVASIQHMTRKTRPVFFEPYTVFNSLFGKRYSYKAINKPLGEAVANLKEDLNDSNLMQANLEGIDLSKAKLVRANLENANLSNSNLMNADLSIANLMNANLSKADLTGTNIYGADLSNSNLNQTNLMGADLRFVNFCSAELSKTNLKRASLNSSNLDNANLAGADLRGASLQSAQNVTCEQIESAVIDKDTRLPDYIQIARPLNSSYQCKNTLKEK